MTGEDNNPLVLLDDRRNTSMTRAGVGVEFVCPECRVTLKQTAEGFQCSRCGNVGSYVDGVPCFTDPEYYWGEVPKETMRLANEIADARGWKAAVEETVPTG